MRVVRASPAPVRSPVAAPAEPDVRLDDIAFAAGLHLYALELRPDDTYEALVITRLSDVLVGGGAARVPTPDQWYDNHVHPDDRARYDALFDPDRVRAGGQFELSYRLVRDDGRQFEVIERARARRLPDGRVLLEGSVSRRHRGARRASPRRRGRGAAAAADGGRRGGRLHGRVRTTTAIRTWSSSVPARAG